MANEYAISMDFWDRVQPKIKQWEITHGRPMPKQQYQALVEGALSAETTAASDRFIRGKALDLEQQKIDLAKEKADAAERAAGIKGVTDIGVATGTGVLAWKNLGIMEKSAAANERLVEGLFGTKGIAPAVELSKPGALALPASGTPALELGGQAALAKTAPILQAETSFASAAPMLAEAEAGGAAAGAEVVGAAGPGLGATALAGAAGYATGYIASKILGANEDISQALELGGAGIGIGFMLGGPVGAGIGALIGVGASLFDDSVVCSELLRQGRISQRDRTACVVFRFRYITDDMFEAYLRWAKPHVVAMRRGGWRNRIRLPFAHAFVGYMVKTAKHQKPTLFEKIMYGYAWGRCRFIAESARASEEVLHGIS